MNEAAGITATEALQLYGCGTPNVLKVMLMLAETGLAYTLHKVDVHAGEQFEPEFLALNPNNKVPVIVDPQGPDGAPITVFESGAILCYLAEKTGRFLPKELRARSEVMQWLMLQMSGIGPMFGQTVHFFFMAPSGNEYPRRRYLTETKRLYDVIERRLAGSEWLGGSDYSIADMATFPWIAGFHRYQWSGIDLKGFPNLQRWIEAIRQRPAYAAAFPPYQELARQTLQAQRQATREQLDRFLGRGSHFRS